MNSVTDSEKPDYSPFSSPSSTLRIAEDMTDDSIRQPRYHLWNLKRLGWSDEDILKNAPSYHGNLVNAIKATK